MKRTNKHLFNKLKQISSFLLILLFFSISAAQVFHSDDHAIKTEQSDLAPKVEPPGDQNLIQISDHCVICDYYVHHHGKQIYLSYAPVINLSYREPTVLKTEIYARVIEPALQNFINKGPPFIT